ncbi:MAG: 16S rRNA (uracil(1498)-N(3))-methyltransferase [Betaproteobacteria bacterium]|nr:16S rRNA (uracil(1498)-N(3))-methyltransferase [Betaproteobacteria bacterium]
MPRFFHPGPLHAQWSTLLSPAAARHAQVLRLQPQDPVQLFNGEGGEWSACIEQMGRKDVQVRVLDHLPVEREAAHHVVLAVGMPANERMDWLVEKATELGVARLVPLMTARSVLRLQSERALKRQAHWQAMAHAACEQCGRNRPPVIEPPQSLVHWLQLDHGHSQKHLLSLSNQGAAPPLGSPHVTLLSGPEGGLSSTEEKLAIAAGFAPWQLGPRTLRAETAALAALTLCAEVRVA